MNQYVEHHEEIIKQIHDIKYNGGNIKDTVTTNKIQYVYDENGNKVYTSGVMTETRVVPVTNNLFQERQRTNWYALNTTDRIIWNVQGYQEAEDTYTDPTMLAALSDSLKAGLSPSSSGSGSNNAAASDSLTNNPLAETEDNNSSISGTNSLGKQIEETYSKLSTIAETGLNDQFTRDGGAGGKKGGGGASSKLGQGISALKNSFDGVMSKIEQYKGFVENTKKSGQGILDKVNGTINEMKDAVLGTISTAQNAFNQIKEKGMGMLDQMTGAVGDVLGRIDQFDLSTIINKFNLGDSEVLSVLASNIGICTGMFDSFASDIINSGINFIKNKFEESGLSERLYGSIGLALKNTRAYDWVILNSIVKPLRATTNVDLNDNDTLLRFCIEYDLPLTLEYLDSYNGTVYNFDRGKSFIDRAYNCAYYGGYRVPKYICEKLYAIYKANTTGYITDNEELAYMAKIEIISIFKTILVYSYDFSVNELNEWTRDFDFLDDFSYYGENDTHFNNKFLITPNDIEIMTNVVTVEQRNGKLYPVVLNARGTASSLLGPWTKQKQYLVLRNKYLKHLYVAMAKDGTKSYERLLVNKPLYERLKMKTLDGAISIIIDTIHTFKTSGISGNIPWVKSVGSNTLTEALLYLEENNLIRPLSARGNVIDRTDIGDWVDYSNKTSGSISSIIEELAEIGTDINNSGSPTGTTTDVTTTTGQNNPVIVEVPSANKKEVIEDTGYDNASAVKPIVIDSTSTPKDEQNEIKETLKDVVKPIEFELMPASYGDFKLIDVTDLSQSDIQAMTYNILKESPYFEAVFEYVLKRFSNVSNTYVDERKFIMYTTKKVKFLALDEERRLNVFYHVLVYNMMVKYAYAYIYADNMNLPGSIASGSVDISGGTTNIDINIIVAEGYDYAFDIEERNIVFPEELYGDVNEVVAEVENRDINFPVELYKDIEFPDGTTTSTEPVSTAPLPDNSSDPLLESDNINFDEEI